MLYRLNSWYDGLLEPRRFLIFFFGIVLPLVMMISLGNMATMSAGLILMWLIVAIRLHLSR